MIPSDRICYPFEETASETALLFAKAVQRMSVYIYAATGDPLQYDNKDSYYFCYVWVKSYSRNTVVLGITAKSIGVEEESVTIAINTGKVSERFSIPDKCSGYVNMIIEESYIKTIPESSVVLEDGDLSLRQELSHVSAISPLILKSCSMAYSGEDTGYFSEQVYGDLVLRSGNNVSLSLSPRGDVFIYSGPGLGSGASDTPPWSGSSEEDPYVGIMSINGINEGGNVNIKLSPTAIRFGAKIIDGNGTVLA